MAILVLILMLLTTPAHAIQMIGFGGGACTCTADQTQTTENSQYFTIDAATSHGQSFKVSKNGSICSLTVRTYDQGTGTPTIQCRVGENSNLTTGYLGSTLTHVDSSDQWTETDIEMTYPAANRPAVSTGTTYYWGCTLTSAYASAMKLVYSSSNLYADGNRRYGSGTTWNMGTNVPEQDMYFIVKMCE